MEGQRSNAGDEGETSESLCVPDSTILGPVIFRFKKSNFPFQKK